MSFYYNLFIVFSQEILSPPKLPIETVKTVLKQYKRRIPAFAEIQKNNFLSAILGRPELCLYGSPNKS